MPIRNEDDVIARSLTAVLTQDYPHDNIEVLIADGMSTDNSRPEIESVLGKYLDIPVKVLDNPRQIVSTGMNIALKQATGKIIIRVDGHTLIAPDYVTECINALNRTGADNVGGRMIAVSESKIGQVIALATSSSFGIGGARFHYSKKEQLVDTVYMGAWRHETLQRIGNFDEELVRNQDDELNYRLRAQGGEIFLSDKIRSQYYNRSSLRSLWDQYYQYGFYKVRVMQKHLRQMMLRQFVPPLFVVTVIAGAVLTSFSQVIFYLWLAALTLYLAVNLLASSRIASKHSLSHFALLPVVFAILHFSYGLGFIVGLIRFAPRWLDRGNH